MSNAEVLEMLAERMAKRKEAGEVNPKLADHLINKMKTKGTTKFH